ncbi:hypothetical protein OROGR_006890 [Orobanche gracilis]
MKKLRHMIEEEEKMRVPIAQGLPWTTDQPECLVKPPVRENTRPFDLVLHSDVRAVDRSEFDHQVAMKMSLIEQYRMESERQQKLKEEEEIRRLRKELVPKAQPMPYFDRPFIPRRKCPNADRQTRQALRLAWASNSNISNSPTFSEIEKLNIANNPVTLRRRLRAIYWFYNEPVLELDAHARLNACQNSTFDERMIFKERDVILREIEEVRMLDDDILLGHFSIPFEGGPWTDPDSVALMIMQSMLGTWNKDAGRWKAYGSELAQRVGINKIAESMMAFNTSKTLDASTVKRVANRFISDKDLAIAAIGPIQGLPDYNWFRRRTYWLRY